MGVSLSVRTGTAKPTFAAGMRPSARVRKGAGPTAPACRRLAFLLDIPESTGEERALRAIRCELQGVPVRRGGLGATPKASQQVGARRMQVRVARERTLVGEPVHHRQADGRTIRERDGHGVVEADHRRGIELDEGLIQRGDLGPIRRGGIGGLVVEGRDGGLQLVRPDPTGRQDRLDERPALGDRGLVPAGPVLVLEQDEVAIGSHPRVPPCVVEEHECQQPGGLRLIGEQRDHGPCQPDRLGTQLAPDQRIAGRRRVALVVDQVEDLEHAVEALGEQVERRHAIRDAGIVDLALGPDEPLGKRRLRDEEGPRDLRCREPAEGPERERDATVHRQCRMAAGEDQPQSVVHVVVRRPSAATFGLDRGKVRFDGGLARELVRLVPEPPAAAQSIDRPIACGRRDPGARVVGYAAGRPYLERRDERLLDGFLGEIEVAEDANECRDRAAQFLAEQAVDDLAGGGRRRQSATTASAGAPDDALVKSQTGRTSTEPYFAPGIIAA